MQLFTRSFPFGQYLSALAVFSATLLLYLSTLAPGMLRGDSGEFQWAMASLNVPHATGYPLFTLLGFAWLHLPFPGPAAWRLNLLSALFGALAVATIFIFARALTRRTDAALLGSIVFALTPVFWFNASILEVYTLNAFLLAVVLFLFYCWSLNPSSSSALYSAFFCLGLALAHHRLMILTVPAVLAFVFLTDRGFFLNWRRLISCALSAAPGLLLYIYIPLRLLPTGATMHYAIYDIILGQEYSGSLLREFQPLNVLWQIPFENFNFWLTLAAVGAVASFRQHRNLAILLALVYVSDAAFALIYSVPDLPVFLTPSFVVIALWIAVGTTVLIQWFSSRVRATPARAIGLALPAILLLLALLGGMRYQLVRAGVAQEHGDAEARARELVQSDLPRGALLELDWETATALRFLQVTEQTRRDLEARLIKVAEREEYFMLLRQADVGRPVFLESDVNWTRSAAGYSLRREKNNLSRIMREPIEMIEVGERLDEHVELAGLRADPGQPLTLFWRVRRNIGRDLATFVHLFDVDGKPLGQSDHGACCQVVYGYRTSEWEPGRIIQDRFGVVTAGTTFLRTGMYSQFNGEIEPHGRTLHLQLNPVQVSPNSRLLNVRLGDAIMLRAYELERAGDHLKLVLYWEDMASVKTDFKVFVHVLDAASKIVTQVDRQPLDGVFPTSAWKPKQVIRESYEFPAAGATSILVGMYDPATQKRLARSDASGDAVRIQLP